MKLLFQKSGLGWKINPQELDNLKNGLEKVGEIEFKFYKSKFSLSVRSFFTEVAHSEPSDPSRSNHVDILLDGAVVAQFFRRRSGFSGTLYDEAIPRNLYNTVEDILSTHGYMTTRKYRKQIRLILRIIPIIIILSLLVSAVYLYKILVLSVPIDRFSPRIVKIMSPEMAAYLSQRQISRFDIFLAIIWFSIGILWILNYFRYKKLFSY